MLTNERLAEIRERCDAATPGPWTVGATCLTDIHCASGLIAQVGWMRDENAANANLMAISREAIPALLDEIGRLRAVERKFHRMLLEQLPGLSHRGEGADAVYFSDGLKGSVEVLTELEAAGLFVQIGTGPNNAIFGKLTEEGCRIMRGGDDGTA